MFNATCDSDINCSHRNCTGNSCCCGERTSTPSVNRVTRNRLRKSCKKCGAATNIHSLIASLSSCSDCDIINELGGDFRISFQEPTHRTHHQIICASACIHASRFTKWRADSINEDDVMEVTELRCHRTSSTKVSMPLGYSPVGKSATS